jgi:hypothetical protein
MSLETNIRDLAQGVGAAIKVTNTGLAATTSTANTALANAATALATANSVVNNTSVINAIGYTPYNINNPSGYISSITGTMVITALGYTPVNPTALSGYATTTSLATTDAKATQALAAANSSNVSGVTGGGTDKVFLLTDTVVTTNYTIPTGKNAMSVGPLTVNTGVNIEISTGSVWTIV